MSWRDCPHCAAKVAGANVPELAGARIHKRLFQLVMALKSYRATCKKGEGWEHNYERLNKADAARRAFEDVLASIAVEARQS